MLKIVDHGNFIFYLLAQFKSSLLLISRLLLQSEAK